MITPKHIIATAVFCLFATTAGAAESYSVKALLMQALSAPDGKARGVVEGIRRVGGRRWNVCLLAAQVPPENTFGEGFWIARMDC